MMGLSQIPKLTQNDIAWKVLRGIAVNPRKELD